MNKKSYSELLKDPRWQKKRLEILNRDNFTCQLCTDTQTELHVHHLEYVDGKCPWEVENYHLITYCKHCHELIEKLKQYDSYAIIAIKFFKNTENCILFAKAINSNGDFECILYLSEHKYVLNITEQNLELIYKTIWKDE